MFKLRRAHDRGVTDKGWLLSRHTFSYGLYYDPDNLGFFGLRVMNDNRVQPGGSWPPHSHEETEIFNYVVVGELEHRDDAGNTSVARPGEIQRISAGTGLEHTTENASRTRSCRFLEFRFAPEKKGLPPFFDQRGFDAEERQGRLRLVVSPDGEDGSLKARCRARVYAGLVGKDDAIVHEVPEGWAAWVQVVDGALDLGGVELEPGDGAAITQSGAVRLTGMGFMTELLFIEVPQGA